MAIVKKKIVELPEDLVANDDDVLVGQDTATNLTKKIKISTLKAGMATLADLEGTTNSNINTITQTAHGFVVGDVIRHNDTQFVKSIASDPLTAAVFGIVTTVTDANTFGVASGGYITSLSGLTPGATYYLSADTAGALTAVEPSGDGTVSKPIVNAVSAGAGYVNLRRGLVNTNADTYARLGINFGISGGTLDLDKMNNDLRYLRRYVTDLRITIPSWDDSSGITNTRAITLAAQKMGFRTSYGVTASGTGHNLAYVNGWKAQVPTEAAWAAAHKIDTFYIGNEEDWWIHVGGITGITESDLEDWVLSEATTLKAAYPDMNIVYSTAEGEVLNWDTKGTGDLDAFGFNIYNPDWNNTVDYFLTLSFGPKMFISEFNTENPYLATGLTAQQYRDYIAGQVKHLRSVGIQGYFFTWDWGSSYNTVDDWGLSNGDGTYKPGLAELFEIIS